MGRRLTSAAVVAGLLLTGCGAADRATDSDVPVPRCPEARPADEISHAGAMPYEIRSSQMQCVLNAVRQESAHDRAFRLKDGRQLHVYQYLGQLPLKPSVQVLASGALEIGGGRWEWSVLDHPETTLVLSRQVPGAYLEFGVPMRDRERDLDLLREIASSLRLR